MSKDQNPIYDLSVSFSLVNFDGDPDNITDVLDLRPTGIVRQGQTFPPPRHPAYRAKYNVWRLKPPAQLPDPLPHHLEMNLVLRKLREALEPKIDRIATLPPCKRTLTVFVIPWSVTPSFGFDPETLTFLGRLGVPFEVDIQNSAPEDAGD